MSKKKKSPGGAREGSGRKPIPPEQRRRPLRIRIDPMLDEYLATVGNKTATVESAVMNSNGYREWKRNL